MFFWRLSQARFLAASSISFWSCTFLLNTFCFRSSFKHFIHIGASFITASSVSFWTYTLSLIICCFLNSSTHFIHIGLSTPKITSLYLTMVSLMDFSRYSTPLLPVTTLTISFCPFIFCNSQLGYKKLSSIHLLKSSFIPQNIHCDLNHSTCYIAGFLHPCIYTFKHLSGDGSFYFVCIESIFNTVVASQYMCHEISWPWKFVLMHSFHVFSLSCMFLLSRFIESVVKLSSSCNAISFKCFYNAAPILMPQKH